MIERSIHTIWCDDIREEAGNKPSFMGVYTGDMVFPKLPATMPRLAVHASFITPSDRPFQTLKFRIVRNDDTLGEITVPMEQLEAERVARNTAGAEARAVVLKVALLMNNVEVPEGTRFFQIKAETEDGSLESFKLRVAVNPSIFEQHGQGRSAVSSE